MTRILFAVVTLLTLSAPLGAAETARQILDRRKALDDTARQWVDRHQRMKLTIGGDGVGERVRELDLYERKYPGDEQKSIVFLRAPADLKGTALLAFTHKAHASEQWLYLPGLKRVRRITANTRNNKFVGTDLTYHDLDLLSEMLSWSEEDASSHLRGEESIDGVRCHVIELTPRRADIGYGYIVLWLGRDDLVPRQVEFHETSPSMAGTLLQAVAGKSGEGVPAKRVRQGDVRLVGASPIAHSLIVETPAEGTRTTIEIAQVELNQDLKDELFSQRSMERGIK